MRRIFAAVPLSLYLLCLCGPVAARAQLCAPGTTSHEADLFGIRSLSLAMTRAGAVRDDPPGTVRAGAEAMWLPPIDDETARATTCRPGKGPENVNALAVAGRLRASVALPAHVLLELSWIPPITLKDMRANLVGVAIGKTHPLSPTLALSARAHALFGNITGPFTCPDDAVADATSQCFNGTRSSDRLEPNVFGADVALGWRRPLHNFSWYAGAGYSRLRPRFRVHFVDAQGVRDSTRVEVDLDRATFFAGGSRALASWRFSLEAYAANRDGMTLRAGIDRAVK